LRRLVDALQLISFIVYGMNTFIPNRSTGGAWNRYAPVAYAQLVFFTSLFCFGVWFFPVTYVHAQEEISASVSDTASVDSAALDSTVQGSPVSAVAAVSEEAKPTGLLLFNKWNTFLLILFFSLAIVFYTRRAKDGKSLFIRKIPGLEAIEDAVGRATEMGRTVLFIPGIQELDEIQTIAGVTILGRIAKITAEYETPLMVPVRYPLVFAGAQEIVKQSYTEVGRRDSYKEDTVRYVAGEQFAFTAHVNGWMMREKPAANIYMGGFFAESLLLAENGFASGAIQIAGTAETAQLPFFIVACDYTLIGEELYAASAYLSHEPLLLGGLKGQDLFKATLIVIIILGVFGVLAFPETLGKWLLTLLNNNLS
jgi:Domain of unknown function (DUF6754)